MIKKGSKIYVKDNSVFGDEDDNVIKVGDSFEVLEITESYIKASNTLGLCVFSMNEFEKYFTDEDIAKKEGESSKWSEWKSFDLDGIGFDVMTLYKTKGRKTHVIVYNADYDRWYSGRSSACGSDTKSLTSGIYVAFGHAISKMGYESGISTHELLKDNPSIVNVFKVYYNLPKNWKKNNDNK